MKRILFFLILASGFVSLSAQDLIVTSSRDSINCKVKKVDQDNIYYSVNGQDAVISLIKVKTCRYNYFLQKLPVATEPAQPAEQEKSESLISNETAYKHFRFAIDGGAGYRSFYVGSGLTSKLTDYYNKLKLGFNASADITYFFSEKRGIGIKTSMYRASNSLNNACLFFPVDGVFYAGFIESGKIGDDITIIYLGPSYTTRLYGNLDPGSLLLTVSAGYTRYMNNMVSITSYKVYGNTLGFALEIAYDYAITKNIALGIQGSLYGGTVSSLTLKDSTGSASYDYSESLLRFDLGIGIRF